MLRRVLLASSLTLAAVTLAAAGGFLYLRTALPLEEGSVRLEGLRAPVEVWRDSLGVPHIWAEGMGDMLFAQGYVHAQDRLWQMELLRRTAEGRLAEILGAALLPTDRYLRTVGLWEAAGRAEAELSDDLREWFDAYCEGVNAWLREPHGALPPELVLLRIRPRPWTPRHVLAIEKIMGLDLSLYGTSRSATLAAKRLGEEGLRHALPGYPLWGPTIVDGPPPPAPPREAAALLAAGSIAHASNAWVIGGEHTASGKPILANDMHLALRAPSLWYLAALHAEVGPSGDGHALDVVGTTIPGAPFIVTGHNRAVAWGFTNAMVDDVELFIERVDPADPGRYLAPGGSLPFEVRVDTIPVRGRREGEVLRIRSTRHGPVISDLDGRDGGEVLALRWAAHDPAGTFRAVPAMNGARSADELIAAIESFDNPHQNVVYADTAGAFGYVMGGRVPLRANGSPPPLHAVPGWTGEWDWTGELSFEEHPRTRSPARGYVVTANNRQTAGEAAARVTSFWADPFRAVRITQLVEEAIAHPRPLDGDAAHRIQLDIVDARGARYRDGAAEAAEAAGFSGEAALLASWDGEAGRDSRAAALFYAWWDEVRSRSADDLYGGGGGWFPTPAVDEVLERQTLPWRENGAVAFRQLSVEAMQAAIGALEGAALGDVHTIRAEHALSGVALLERTLRLDVGGVAHAGTPATVNVAQWPRGPFPKTTTYGPSQRHVVDMGAVDEGGFILPTGQSGLPFSRHYRDQFPVWREGGLWAVPLARPIAEARAVRRLELIPRNESTR